MTASTIPFTHATRPDLRFWKLQLAIWSGYGLALMIPWLGTYSIATMLPNKIVIAGTGLLTSTGLREVYRLALRPGFRKEVLVVLGLVASIAGGIAWSTATAGLVGWSISELVRTPGTLVSGIPQFGGAFYHALVLLTWSLAYLAWIDRQPALAKGSGRLVLRDGRRSIVLEPGEIDWISARGDYVHVHIGGRRLLLRETIGHLANTLPAAHYLRIHRSAIVNVARVREMLPRRNREYQVFLNDGTELRASRTYAEQLRSALGVGRNGSLPPADPAAS